MQLSYHGCHKTYFAPGFFLVVAPLTVFLDAFFDLPDFPSCLRAQSRTTGSRTRDAATRSLGSDFFLFDLVLAAASAGVNTKKVSVVARAMVRSRCVMVVLK